MAANEQIDERAYAALVHEYADTLVSDKNFPGGLLGLARRRVTVMASLKALPNSQKIQDEILSEVTEATVKRLPLDLLQRKVRTIAYILET